MAKCESFFLEVCVICRRVDIYLLVVVFITIALLVKVWRRFIWNKTKRYEWINYRIINSETVIDYGFEPLIEASRHRTPTSMWNWTSSTVIISRPFGTRAFTAQFTYEKMLQWEQSLHRLRPGLYLDQFFYLFNIFLFFSNIYSVPIHKYFPSILDFP